MYYATRANLLVSVPTTGPVRRINLASSRSFKVTDWAALALAISLAGLFTWMRRPWHPPGRLMAVLGVTLAFALLAWIAHGVNLSGALAGYAVAFVLAASDLRLFAALLIVFALVLAATRLGSKRKLQLRAAESSEGRSASQVMANLGVAGFVVALAPSGWPVFVLALAALAEAAADTCSSEAGMAFPARTVLITTWRPIAPGLDGGISLIGTAAAIIAAAVVGLAGIITRLISPGQIMIVVLAGFLGTVVDSLLGATLERRGWLNNDLVNLLSTSAAVGIAWMMMIAS